MLRFVNTEIPYDQIDRVETRCVLFGRTFAPVLLRATRIVTKDGRHVRLGNVNEDNIDQALPFPEIGAKIAERAGARIVDGGMVRRSIERRVMGFIGRKTALENSPRHHRGRDGRDQRPPQPRHALSGDRHGRAGGGRHRHGRVHGAEDLVCHRRHVRPIQEVAIAVFSSRTR